MRVHVDTARQEVDNDFVVWYKQTEDISLKGQGVCVQSNIIQTDHRATRNPKPSLVISYTYHLDGVLTVRRSVI